MGFGRIRNVLSVCVCVWGGGVLDVVVHTFSSRTQEAAQRDLCGTIESSRPVKAAYKGPYKCHRWPGTTPGEVSSARFSSTSFRRG